MSYSSLTIAENLRRRAAQTKGGDSLLLRAADALDQQSRVLEYLSSEPAITVAEHVELAPWLKPILELK